MFDLGQPVFDLMLVADPAENIVEGASVVRHAGELAALDHAVRRAKRSVAMPAHCSAADAAIFWPS
ncbi:hypothetical protein L288_08780 [Sphingobium quisquiliarum P25]|uniref:Uncharacterized protein n=1 Tax=Sphingobium quisquiliarum P25 TaxID=1329909 RepID=T0IEL6_9SPHN|nr:hypothetical protein L288_08780 [Sphingobium quisquiliarum P25]